MNILMIDTSGPACGVAIMADGRLVYEAELTHKQTHSQRVMPMVDAALQMSDMTLEDMDVLGAVVGPGSFTGVRIGVSLVKGLAFANHTPCAAVSPLEALAKAHEAFPGVVCAVMDARRGQYYNALFEDGERLCSDRAVGTETLCAELADGPVLICGDGAELFCERAAMPNLRLAPACAREQNALSVALCGHRLMTLGQAVTPDKLSPVYLRKPQAEREREERLSKGDSAK